nr:retrotransposon protein, putative, Ty1-copia subclass [Tanacetum cinerariifolium]
MKGYVEKLERLGYVLPKDICVGLILNGLTSDFTRFVRNYNMHNMRKTIGELHALLVEYEKGLSKKVATPQVMAIQGDRIQKANKKSQIAKVKAQNPKPSAKERPSKDDTCHHCKEVGHWKKNCPVYLAKLIMKKKQVGTAMFKNEVENQLGKTIKALRSDRGGEYISQEFKDYLKACGIVQQLTPPYTPQHNGVSERRNHTLLDMVRSMMNLTTLPLSFWDYALESATRILNMVPTKKVDKTPYELWYEKVLKLSYLKETMGYYFYFPPENKIVVARYAEFFEKNLITQEVSGRAIDLKEIQDEDTSPSEITSEIPMEVEGFEPPQEKVIPICRSERIHRAPDHLCLNIEVEEHSLGDLNEPASYKAAMVILNSTGFDYEETFSPVADIRAIRILISIAAFYDYEIWKMDVKIAFLNGYLDEDIYMVQPEGFVDPNHPRKDLGEATFILGIKIYRDRTQVASTPKEVKHMQNVPYASAVGSIMYAVRCTRLDVAFAQNITSRFQENPGECHWTAVKHIL